MMSWKTLSKGKICTLPTLEKFTVRWRMVGMTQITTKEAELWRSQKEDKRPWKLTERKKQRSVVHKGPSLITLL